MKCNKGHNLWKDDYLFGCLKPKTEIILHLFYMVKFILLYQNIPSAVAPNRECFDFELDFVLASHVFFLYINILDTPLTNSYSKAKLDTTNYNREPIEFFLHL